VRYAPKDSPLHAVQAKARSGRRGLCQQVKTVPPWEWRSVFRVGERGSMLRTEQAHSRTALA